jgi:hypothetical protein
MTIPEVCFASYDTNSWYEPIHFLEAKAVME